MDPLTQGLLGASFGQALCGRALGRRALVWGGLVGMTPDLDVAMNATGPMGEWLYHRGASHSLWFGPVVGPLVGWLLWRLHGRRDPLAAWIGLPVVALFTHPLLDVFTSYGTMLLAPFSDRRFAWDAVAIVDPAYSLVLVAALGLGLAWGPASGRARIVAAAGLALTTAYLGYGLVLNHRAEDLARRQLAAEGVTAAEVRAYPTLLQVYLRRVVVRRGDELRVGWLSLWRPAPLEWHRFADARHPLAAAARATEEGRILEWFAMGQTAAALVPSASGTVVEIDDLRYGFPSRPQAGLWGIRVRFDPDGRIEGRPQRVDRPLPAPAPVLLGQLWRGTFGLAP